MTYSDNYSNDRYPYFEQYSKQPYTHSNHIQQPVPVKVEVNDSPSLHTAPQYHQQSLAQFSQRPNLPVFRFGDSGSGSISSPSPSTPTASFTFMSSHPWPSLSNAASASSGSSYQQHPTQYASDRLHSYSMPSSMNGHSQGHSQTLPLNDEYDDGEDDALGELPSSGMAVGMGSYGGTGYEPQSSGKGGEKQIRRRSSKACDQCRKSKCKCERSTTQEPCRNCVMLGTRAFTPRRSSYHAPS